MQISHSLSLRAFPIQFQQEKMKFPIRILSQNRFKFISFLNKSFSRSFYNSNFFLQSTPENSSPFSFRKNRKSSFFIDSHYDASSPFLKSNLICRSEGNESISSVESSNPSRSIILNSIDVDFWKKGTNDSDVKEEEIHIKDRKEQLKSTSRLGEVTESKNRENYKEKMQTVKNDKYKETESVTAINNRAVIDHSNEEEGEEEEEEDEDEEKNDDSDDSDEEDYYGSEDEEKGIRLNKSESKRNEVLSFLSAEGIDIELFEGVPLPNDIDVISERLEFLCSLGIEVDQVVNKFPPLLCCSISRNFVPVLNYLETIPIKRHQLAEIITSYPRILYASVVVDLIPIVDYLLGIGVAKRNLGDVVYRFPDVFGLKLEGTMSTSVAYLVGLGVGLRSVGDIITAEPKILGMRVGTNLLPKVRYLESFGILRSQVAKIIESRPFVLRFDLDRQMKSTVNALLSLGVKEEAMGKLIVLYPEVLGLRVSELIPSLNQWMKTEVGLNDEDLPAILSSIPQILSVDFDRANQKLAFFRGVGFSRLELAEMMRKCPRVLGLSLKKSIKPKFDCFVKRMNRPIVQLVHYPQYFMYSLDLIAKRHERLMQDDVACDLQWMLDCDDLKFVDRFDLDVLDGPLDPHLVKPMSDSNDW